MGSKGIGLRVLMAEVREVNEANGWFDTARTFGDDVALLHSEVSELFEEFRAGASFTENRHTLKVTPGSEIDNRMEELAAEFDWTLDPAIDDPAFEAVIGQLREEHPEAFKPEGIPSELADILIRLLDTADRYGVDLDAAVAEKLAFNRTRGHKHGGKVV